VIEASCSPLPFKTNTPSSSFFHREQQFIDTYSFLFSLPSSKMARSRRTTPQTEQPVVASTAPVNTTGTRARSTRSTRSQSHDVAATQPVPVKATRQRGARQASVESASSAEGRTSRARRAAKNNAVVRGMSNTAFLIPKLTLTPTGPCTRIAFAFAFFETDTSRRSHHCGGVSRR